MKLDSSISAVVTGGASGLGLATVKALREKGVKVAIFDFNPENGQKVADETGSVFCQVDVMDEDQVLAAFEKARAANGQERVLINCAGGMRGGAGKTVGRKKDGTITRFDTKAFEETLRLNTVGTFRCITISAAGMLTLEPLPDGDRGAIVNTASAAAVEGQIGQVSYAAAKAGIVGMTLNIARDLSSEAIRCNTIMPGTMATPPMVAFVQHNPAGGEALAKAVPFPSRMGKPEEFAHLATFLVENGYMNGETVRVDGAIRMPPR
jgi:NAD(P)-dependent dehydrogenase (short-subunit alcohol dehydrogenase family)